MDYYRILNVSKTASQDEIKKAYKKLVMTHHPDRGGDPEQFKRVTEAYETLKNPQTRQQYDNPQPRVNTQNFHNYHDVFADFFNQQRYSSRRNRDITIGATLSLNDVINGKAFTAVYRLHSGREEVANIKIPPGAKDGDMIRYGGLGDDSYQGPRGNLMVRISVQSDPKWIRDGDNLITEQLVNVFDLIIGCTINIMTVDSKSVRVKVPRGTKANTRFSIQEYGLPNPRTRRRGNLYIVVKADIPNVNDEEMLEKIRNIRNEIDSKSR